MLFFTARSFDLVEKKRKKMRDTTNSKNTKCIIGVEFNNELIGKIFLDGNANNDLMFRAGLGLLINSNPSEQNIQKAIRKLKEQQNNETIKAKD
jgi:hypothetical protein